MTACGPYGRSRRPPPEYAVRIIKNSIPFLTEKVNLFIPYQTVSLFSGCVDLFLKNMDDVLKLIRKGIKMKLNDAIAVLEKERLEQGMDMLELLIDVRDNRQKYETNTRAIVILAADTFNAVGQEFFADVE